MGWRMTSLSRRASVSSTQKLVLLLLASWNDDASGRCDPSTARIMQESGLSNRAVATALQALEKGGFITATRRLGARSSYLLHPERGEMLPDRPVSEVQESHEEPVSVVQDFSQEPVKPVHESREEAVSEVQELNPQPVNLLPKPVNEVQTNLKNQKKRDLKVSGKFKFHFHRDLDHDRGLDFHHQLDPRDLAIASRVGSLRSCELMTSLPSLGSRHKIRFVTPGDSRLNKLMAVDLTSVPQSDPLRVYRYRDGLYAADLLTAAVVHLDFFTWLGSHPSSKKEICARFEFAERPVDVMLTLFAANGFVEQRDGRFHPTLTAQEHLTSGSPWCLAPYYASLKDRPITQDYLKVLKTGRPANWGGDEAALDWHKAMETDAFSRSFTAAMDCRGFYLGQALAKKVDLSGRTHLLDIGGGSGIYACSLVAHHPDLRATVFEQPPVDRITQRCIVERGCPDRVSVQSGDMFKDALPTDADVHLFSNVLHDWDYLEVRQLLAISHAALPSGGLLIIHDAFINEDKTGPLPVAEYSALLMHSTQGKCYGVSEYASLLREMGFEPGAYEDTAADRGFMTAVKP